MPHATRGIWWGGPPEWLGQGGKLEIPRGAQVWPAAVDATFLKKQQQCWGRQKVEQKTRQKTKQRPLRGGTGKDIQALPKAGDQARLTSDHIPHFHTWRLLKVSYVTQHSFGFLFNEIQRHGFQSMWSPELTILRQMSRHNVVIHTDTYTHTYAYTHIYAHIHTYYSLHC